MNPFLTEGQWNHQAGWRRWLDVDEFGDREYTDDELKMFHEAFARGYRAARAIYRRKT